LTFEGNKVPGLRNVKVNG